MIKFQKTVASVCWTGLCALMKQAATLARPMWQEIEGKHQPIASEK